ncbi:MAG: hypothetical protein IAF02_14565 [Anaerolineae bacterium]|nr:hypothetical protein [Anaerolineae bacterium]
MPDGDIIHPRLNRRFSNVYAQICEGHWDDLGYRMLHPLKGQIQEFGNKPISMGQEMLPILANASSLIQAGQHLSFKDFSFQITELSKNPIWNCNPKGRDIMVLAAKKVLFEIKNGKIPLNMETMLYRNYLNGIYEKEFEGRVYETPAHYKDANPIDIQNMIEDIRPHVNLGLDEYVYQLVKYKDVSKLSRPHKLKEPPPTIDDEAW